MVGLRRMVSSCNNTVTSGNSFFCSKHGQNVSVVKFYKTFLLKILCSPIHISTSAFFFVLSASSFLSSSLSSALILTMLLVTSPRSSVLNRPTLSHCLSFSAITTLSPVSSREIFPSQISLTFNIS